jgi:cytidylate kinase
MTADSSVRVERRFKELFEKNPNVTIEEIKSNLEMRDYIDSHREISPLKKAKDSMLLDNTTLTQKEQFQKAMEWVEKKLSVR